MNSYTILFLIVVSLVAYSLVATYLFWLMRHDQRYLDRKLSGARSDISTLATAYEYLRSLLEDKAQAPKPAPRTPRPLRGKQEVTGGSMK